MSKVILALVALYLPPLSAAADAPDPWASFKLKRIECKDGTLSIDPAVISPHDKIKAALEEEMARYRAGRRRREALMRKMKAITTQVNELLGFTPDEKQATEQEKIYSTFGASPFGLVSADKLGVYILMKEKTKEYLKNGGKLPGFSYDAASDVARYQFNSSSGLSVDLELLPIMLSKPDAAVKAVHSIIGEDLVSTFNIGPATMIHELVEGTIIFEMLDLQDPHSRWFTDGVANVLTIQMLNTIGEKAAVKEIMEGFDASPYMKTREELNLRYWLAGQYDINVPIESEKLLTDARRAYATYEMSRLIENHGGDCVKKILEELRTKPKQSSGDLFAAVRKVTGEDMVQRLLRYQRFRTAEQGAKRYDRACAEARKAGDYEDVFTNLKRLMELKPEMTQDPDSIAVVTDVLARLGHHEAGRDVIRERIEDARGAEDNMQLEAFQQMYVSYAFTCRDLPKAYEVANEYLQSHPDNVLAMLVVAHALKAQGKIGESKAAVDAVRRGLKDVDAKSKATILGIIAEFLEGKK